MQKPGQTHVRKLFICLNECVEGIFKIQLTDNLCLAIVHLEAHHNTQTNVCCDCIVNNNNCYHNVYRWKRENGMKAYAATVLWVITRIRVVMGWFRIKLFTV